MLQNDVRYFSQYDTTQLLEYFLKIEYMYIFYNIFSCGWGMGARLLAHYWSHGNKCQVCRHDNPEQHFSITAEWIQLLRPNSPIYTMS